MAKVFHSEIYGLREAKYDWLNKHNIKNVKWKRVTPHPEFYLFIPTDNKLANHYYSFEKITEIFPVNSVGIVTARDNFVIDFDKKKLERRIEEFRNPKIEDAIIKQTYDLNENQSWKIKTQREKLRKDLDWKDSITQILYRPFDVRWILYHDGMIERSRREVMENMDENIGLIARRQMLPNKPMNYFFVSDKIIADGVIRSDNKGGESLFPLYIYIKSKSKKKDALYLYLEGLGFRSIGRYLKVSHVAVYNWIKSYGEEIEKLRTDKEIEVVELDEMRTYIMSKKTIVGYGLLLVDLEKNLSTSLLATGVPNQAEGYGKR